MSKTVTIETRLRDEAVLKDALKSLGYSIREGKDTFSIRRGRIPVMEFRKRPSGEIEALVDIERHSGEALDEIKQRYAMLKILKETEKAGFSCVKQEVDADRNLKIVVRKWQAA